MTRQWDPAGITYLKLDLRGVTMPFTRATLVLSCTNESSYGGTVYLVPDSSWIASLRVHHGRSNIVHGQ